MQHTDTAARERKASFRSLALQGLFSRYLCQRTSLQETNVQAVLAEKRKRKISYFFFLTNLNPTWLNSSSS